MKRQNAQNFFKSLAVRVASNVQLALLNQRLDPMITMRIGFPDASRPPDGFARVSNLLYSKYYNTGLSAQDATHHKYRITLLQ
jgi:hypothetical protein